MKFDFTLQSPEHYISCRH